MRFQYRVVENCLGVSGSGTRCVMLTAPVLVVVHSQKYGETSIAVLCPYCEKRHWHDWPDPERAPGIQWSLCGDGKQYLIGTVPDEFLTNSTLAIRRLSHLLFGVRRGFSGFRAQFVPDRLGGVPARRCGRGRLRPDAEPSGFAMMTTMSNRIKRTSTDAAQRHAATVRRLWVEEQQRQAQQEREFNSTIRAAFNPPTTPRRNQHDRTKTINSRSPSPTGY